MKAGKRFSEPGRRRGQPWSNRRREQNSGKLFEMNKKVMESNPKLTEFYVQTLAKITNSGQKSPAGRQKMAMELTRDFAKQNNIPWRR